jgi:hypothetical protein
MMAKERVKTGGTVEFEPTGKVSDLTDEQKELREELEEWSMKPSQGFLRRNRLILITAAIIASLLIYLLIIRLA